MVKKKKKEDDTELVKSFEEMAESEHDIDEEESEDSDIRSLRPKKRTISREWYLRLTKELDELKNEKLSSVIDRIKEAVSFWDLRENSEYESALADKDFIEQRISELLWLLEWVEIEDTSSVLKNDQTVKYGSHVKLEFINTKDDSVSIEIVSTWELSYEAHLTKISFESPVGMAIEWKKIWDVVRVRAESWRYQVKIIDIS